MRKSIPLSQAFEYKPERVDLIGFPNHELLTNLSKTFGQEIRYEYSTKRPSRIPFFNPEYIERRKNFFDNHHPYDIDEDLERKTKKFNFPYFNCDNISNRNFHVFCERVYTTLTQIESAINQFKNLPESKQLIQKINDFEDHFNGTLQRLASVGESRYLALDTTTGHAVEIDKMPIKANNKNYLGRYCEKIESDVFRITVKMKKEAMRAKMSADSNFKRRVIDFVDNEFMFNNQDNIRNRFEQIGIPLRLLAEYRKNIEPFVSGYMRIKEDLEEEIEEGEISLNFPIIYPTFAQHYDIQGLFPPSVIRSNWNLSRGITPIDFKTARGENKFLLAGLHSGGKSFFLENLVLTSIIGQIPFRMPATKLVIPKYDNIYYFRNLDNGQRGAGKWETEMRTIYKIIEKSSKKDLLVFDELLDSTTTGVATWLLPEVLAKLRKLPATVFISTHRGTDYKKVQEEGWTVMSPAHTVDKKLIIPAKRLVKELPNEKINRQYVRQKLEELDW